MMAINHNWIKIVFNDTGEEKEIFYPVDYPDWRLIKATTDPSGRVTPRITDHDRFDFRRRDQEKWEGDCWDFVKKQMEGINRSWKAYGVNPFIAVGGSFSA